MVTGNRLLRPRGRRRSRGGSWRTRRRRPGSSRRSKALSDQRSSGTGGGRSKTSLLSKDECKSLVECVSSRRMKQLSPACLKLRAKPHEKLIESTSLLMLTATETGCAGDGGSYSMYRTLRWRESINLSPELTEPTIELIDGLISLLKSAQSLVECKDLSLAGNTVTPGKVCPHCMSSGKISYLSPDPRGDRLADHHLGGRVICVPFLQLLLEGIKKSGR